MKNVAAVMTDIRKFEFKEVPMPVVKEGEVGIAIKDVGICGSDLHFFNGDAQKIFPNALPFILGHECGGVIYEVGKGVEDLKEGDQVAIEPGVPCGRCEFCRSGRYNLCEKVRFMAVPPYNGGLQKYISYPAYMVYKLPEGMSTMEGALLEPLSVGLHAAARGEVTLGSSVAILGAGCIGMCTLLAAKAQGASRIIVTDIVDSHLERALELGATDAVNSRTEDVLARIKELTDRKGTDVVFETAGIAATAVQTGHIVKRGGTIVMVGNIFGDVPFSFRNIYVKEAQVRGVFRYHSTYPAAIEAVASGRIDIKRIVTGVYPFDDAEKAFNDALDNKEQCIKNVIRID
ncbi:MAG: NAD(P)-dependent alcohol dehydrogenase [Clostridiaceae bacterium]|nr:NAD(P)-dependent alcohol dehydrogenase [Clostridiaceae bacterium]